MSEEKPKLSGPDLAQGVELSAVPDGTMLLGHAHGEPVLLVRRGDELFAIGASARTMAPRSNRGCSWAIRFVARGITPVSACAPARLSARRRWILSPVGASKRCATWRVSHASRAAGRHRVCSGKAGVAQLGLHTAHG